MRLRTKWVQAERACLQLGRYPDGSRSVELRDGSGFPLLKATVCLSQYGENPAEGHVFIKDWSENEGVLEALQQAGVVGEVTRTVPCGYTQAHEVPLLVQ